MPRRAAAVLLLVPLLFTPAFAGDDLLDAVPDGAYSVWHRRATPETALADGYFYEVVDAVLAARFDQVVLDLLTGLSAPPDVLDGVTTMRNVIAGMLGGVPWRDLVQSEFLFAETLDPPLLPEFTSPSYLFASRPESDRVPALTGALKGLLSSFVAITGPDVAYEVSAHAGKDGQQTDLHTVRIPALGDAVVFQLAFHGDRILMGSGPEFFDRALHLMSGGEGPRLSAAERWISAFRGLPADAPSRVFVDSHQLMQGMQDLVTRLALREPDSARWLTLVEEVFSFMDLVDTAATTTTYRGTEIVTETITRYHAETAAGHPAFRASVAEASSGELIEYVPADVVAFEARGAVDLLPLYRFALDRLRKYWSRADDALWAFDVFQAMVDFSIESDLLSWLGSERIRMEFPSRNPRAAPGATDSVTLRRLRDARGARKSIERLHSVFTAAVPRLLNRTHGVLREGRAGPLFLPGLQLRKGAGGFSTLYEFEVSLGGFSLPKLTFGVLGNLLVTTTSTEALDHCLAVATGEVDGLAERPALSHLLAEGRFSSAGLRPVGRQMQSVTQTLGGLGGVVQGGLAAVSLADPKVTRAVESLSSVLPKLTSVLATIDFYGDELRHTELREGGWSTYERKTQHLLRPEQRPSFVASGR